MVGERALDRPVEALAIQATTDPLTGLFNRRAFFDKAEELAALNRRYKNDLSILIDRKSSRIFVLITAPLPPCT